MAFGCVQVNFTKTHTKSNHRAIAVLICLPPSPSCFAAPGARIPSEPPTTIGSQEPVAGLVVTEQANFTK